MPSMKMQSFCDIFLFYAGIYLALIARPISTGRPQTSEGKTLIQCSLQCLQGPDCGREVCCLNNRRPYTVNCLTIQPTVTTDNLVTHHLSSRPSNREVGMKLGETLEQSCSRHHYKLIRRHEKQYCLQMYTKEVTWDQALFACQQDGASLVLVKTRVKMSVLREMANKGLEGYECYIGLRDFNNNRTFSWLDGTPLDYENWYKPSEPSYRSGDKYENCVHLRGSWLGTGAWNDIGCRYHRPFICEISEETF